MKSLKNILVVSELNKESYEALAYGIILGLMYDAKVSCIHVMQSSPIDIIKENFLIDSDQYKKAVQNAKMESESLLSHIIDVIASEIGVGEVDVDLKIVSGVLSKSILNHADHLDADLVIIGTEPATRLSRTPHTNLALNMIKLEERNVLLIPAGFKMERIEQIGAFITFGIEDLEFVQQLIKFSKRTEQNLKLIHVLKDGQSLDTAKYNKSQFEKILAKEIKDKEVEITLEIGKVEEIVNSLKQKHNIDLMVMRAYQKHWSIYSSPSTFADKVIKNIKTPLLVRKPNTNKQRISV